MVAKKKEWETLLLGYVITEKTFIYGSEKSEVEKAGHGEQNRANHKRARNEKDFWG